MGSLPQVRKYLYWSERRLRRIAEDNNFALFRPVSTKYKSPGGPFLPQVEVEVSGVIGKDKVANKVETYLSGVTVRDFSTPPPVRFAAGRGTVTFAEFVNGATVENVVSMFSESVSSTGDRVAVCMFGSRENLAEMIGEAPTKDLGWSSSAAPEIFRFIRSAGSPYSMSMDDREVAEEVINLLCHQGGDANKPARRGFTYGHVGEVGEWMMEVYKDVLMYDKSSYHGSGYDRVVIGAPLWVRTPSATPLTLYGLEAGEIEPPFRGRSQILPPRPGLAARIRRFLEPSPKF